MTRVVLAFWLIAAFAPTSYAASYEDPAHYCTTVGTIDRPDARYKGDAVPDWIARALMHATGAPDEAGDPARLAAFKRAAWRCDRGQVLACSFGANIPCDQKADTSRKAPPGAVAFCRDNPGAGTVPAVATGHATIYEWRCRGDRPGIARQVLQVDQRGFPAAFWHVVSPETNPQR